MKFDRKVGELLQMLEELGIAENTLIVLMADNGAMEGAWPDLTYQNPGIFRGGKNDFLEGGVRVPAFAYWPGVIQPGQVVGDMVHVSDLFTTFAVLGGAKDRIPTDRRRDYVYIYQGPMLAAIVKQQYKHHFAGAAPGLAGKGFFDLYKDPREEHPLQAQFLWSWPAFDHIKAKHEAQIKQYPHTEVARGEPYAGIERLEKE